MISKEEVKKLSHLAKISVDDEELNSLHKDLEKILRFVSVLKGADVLDLEDNGFVFNVMRGDEIFDCCDEEAKNLMMNQAICSVNGFVKVKKILDDQN